MITYKTHRLKKKLLDLRSQIETVTVNELLVFTFDRGQVAVRLNVTCDPALLSFR